MTKESSFLRDVVKGLSQNPKTLPSQYFYDKIGDGLFQQIMSMPEYYLTNSESEIFQKQSAEIIASFGMDKNQPFDLIELGAGDGSKTLHLLKELLNQQYQFSYLPVDISQNALNTLLEKVTSQLPDIEMEPKQGDYFQVLDEIFADSRPKIILFIGSNLGNMPDTVAAKFLQNLSKEFKSEDKLLLGLDLTKAKNIVLPAYNDANGITKKFNINLLHRMNEELGANFDLDSFSHEPEYDEAEGIARSYLKSLKKQTVYFASSETYYHFEDGEKLLTEISRKYNDSILNTILKDSDLKIKHQFLDSKNYFADFILEKN